MPLQTDIDLRSEFDHLLWQRCDLKLLSGFYSLPHLDFAKESIHVNVITSEPYPGPTHIPNMLTDNRKSHSSWLKLKMSDNFK